MKQFTRKKKLIEPRLQLRFALLFFAFAGFAALVQVVVLNYLLGRISTSLPNDGIALMGMVPQLLLWSFGLTVALLVPVGLGIGVLSTFPIVGPIYRFRRFLEGVIAGEQREACTIRAKDELKELCDLINEATAPLRQTSGSATEPQAQAPSSPLSRSA